MNSYHIMDVALDTVSYGVSGFALDKLDVVSSLQMEDYVEYAVVDLIIKNLGLSCSIPLTTYQEFNNRVYHWLTMVFGKSIIDVVRGRGTSTLKKNVLVIGGGEVVSTAVNAIRAKF